MTYRKVADRLDLSESAVKHMFSTANFSLKRLDELCEVLELDIAELVALSEAQEQRIERLPAEFDVTRFLRPGQEMRLGVEGLGEQRQRTVADG